MSRKLLDLGCGIQPRPETGYESYGIDKFVSGDNISNVDLSISPIQFEDNYFDKVVTYDFLDHIPTIAYLSNFFLGADVTAINAHIRLMNEIYRVLKPNGTFFAQHPDASRNIDVAMANPTHVSIWTPGR